MLNRFFFKNSILTLGIIIFFLFLYQLKDSAPWKRYREKLSPTTCSLILEKVRKETQKAPSTDDITIECLKNNLEITITLNDSLTKESTLKDLMLKEMANRFVEVSLLLKDFRTKDIYTITVKIQKKDNGDFKGIKGMTEGLYVSQLHHYKAMPKSIIEYLHKHVKVSEF